MQDLFSVGLEWGECRGELVVVMWIMVCDSVCVGCCVLVFWVVFVVCWYVVVFFGGGVCGVV